MLKKILGRIGKLILIVAALNFLWYLWAEHQYRKTIPMGEVIGPDEGAMMADAIAMALSMINNSRDDLIDKGMKGISTQVGKDGEHTSEPRESKTGKVTYRRDVHTKGHGCLKATFTTLDVDERYRWGVLSEAHKKFPAWIRFSNGNPYLTADWKPDARGMAIKLMGVEGTKLLKGQKDAKTQDFVMMNATNYFIRSPADYVELTKYLAVESYLGYFLNGPSWNVFSWRFRELRLVGGTKKLAPETPFEPQYFSASAYQLGQSNYVKFSAKPIACPNEPEPPGSYKTSWFEDNSMRGRLVEHLEQAPACFAFMMQSQVPGKMMPVEDATIAWSEKDSPFVPVARIEVPKQSFNSPEQNDFCEDLSFNPWHSLPAHKPVGVFNRIRKALYEEVAKYRWDANRRQYGEPDAPGLVEMQPPEPTSWCLPGQQKECGPALD